MATFENKQQEEEKLQEILTQYGVQKLSSQQLFAILQHWGLTGTTTSAQILNALKDWNDINGDIANFNRELSRYYELSELMNKMQENTKNIIRNLNHRMFGSEKELNPAFRQFSNDLEKEFNELKEKFGTPEMIQQQRNELLQRSQLYELLALIGSWIEIYFGYKELINHNKQYELLEQELIKTETKYIQPIFQIYEETGIIEETRIEIALSALNWVKEKIEDEKKIALQRGITHGVQAFSNGFALASSIAKVVALGTNSWATFAQWGIAALQGSTVVAHTGLAFWAGQNYYEWKNLLNIIQNKYDQLNLLKVTMLSLTENNKKKMHKN